MVHRTFRRLDEPTKLLGFSLTQWTALIAGGGGVSGLLHVLAVPTKPALTVLAFLVGVPAGLTYTTEQGRIRVGRLLLDAFRSVLATDELRAGGGRRGTYVVEAGDKRRPGAAGRERGRRAEASWD